MDDTHLESEANFLTRRITRRTFLKIAGKVFVYTSIATILDSCSPASNSNLPPSSTEIQPGAYITLQYPEVPESPETLPPPQTLQFFTEDEAKLMDAIAGRILPGTPDDPGAREADVFLYIDHKLGYEPNNGFVDPTYFRPPFAKPYKGDTPPSSSPDNEKVIWVKEAEIDRYGFQSKSTPQETYRSGLASVDQYAQMKYNKKFVDLTEDEQDQILEDMDNGAAQGFKEPTDRVFFKLLREDVIEGMFSDPVYGGNKNMVGWTLIGYPGAQRAYTPDDMHTEGHVRPPQSLAQMPMFHPGQKANPDVIVPPSGSNVDVTPQTK